MPNKKIEISLGSLFKCLNLAFPNEFIIFCPIPDNQNIVNIEIDSGNDVSHGTCKYDLVEDCAFEVPTNWEDAIAMMQELMLSNQGTVLINQAEFDPTKVVQ